jgi:hypothetical protein
MTFVTEFVTQSDAINDTERQQLRLLLSLEWVLITCEILVGALF